MNVNRNDIDRLVLAYRENPTEDNRAALMAAQAAYTDTFYRSQTLDYVRRTK